MFTLIPDGSLQCFSVTQRVLILFSYTQFEITTDKIGCISLYNLDPNGLGILMTNNANISETQCTIQKYFSTFRY